MATQAVRTLAKIRPGHMFQDKSTYPIIGIVSIACGMGTYAMYRHGFLAPDVAFTSKSQETDTRAAVGQKWRERDLSHANREVVDKHDGTAIGTPIWKSINQSVARKA